MAGAKDPSENLAKAEWRIREAAGRGAQIVCVQELYRSQYFCREENAELFDLAESVPGPTSQSFSRLAAELGIVIAGSIFERRTAGVYHNTALVIDADGSLLGLYRKMHIPDDPLYFEKYYFTPGDLGFRCFDTRFARIAVLVMLGPVVSGGGATGRAGRRRCCSIPPPSAGILRKKSSTGWRSTTRGGPSSGPTLSPTGCMWRR